ncbi:MAG: N-acetylneuraminate synthase family protein [Gemmatimonadaceae bacterium]|nr:N-acetylneuraminate synthase family protein [Gemmatimonadaceae bacterium]
MISRIHPIPFGRKWIGPGLPVVIIAEIGINHEGDFETCIRLVEAAARSGADAVKLITVRASENYAPDTESFAVFSRSELKPAETAAAFGRARELGMECFSTCGDFVSAEFVGTLEPAAWKVSSGLLTHLPLIQRLSETGLSLLLSTGMSSMKDAARAVEIARKSGARHIGLFQCTSLYPAPPELLNLRSIRSMLSEFNVPVGLSDHSDGYLAPAIAVAAGAMMIEKHFSLDPTRPGFDHRVSLNPTEFSRMVETVRTAEQMLGSEIKDVPEAVRQVARRNLRGLAAARDIPKDKQIEASDLGVMRVAGEKGLPPEALSTIPGRLAARDIAAYEPITQEDIQ